MTIGLSKREFELAQSGFVPDALVVNIVVDVYDHHALAHDLASKSRRYYRVGWNQKGKDHVHPHG